MHWESKLLKNLNIHIPLAVILLIITGFLALSSAVELNRIDSGGMHYIQKQAVSIVLGVIVIITIQFFDYRIFKYYITIIYGTTVGVLLFMLAGQTVAGGKRWITIGPVNFQPSELSKLVLIIVLAAVLEDNREDLKYLSGMIKPFSYFLPLFLLVVFQNDLGTALVLFVIFLVMVFIGGGNIKFMGIIFGGGFLLIILIIVFHLIFGTPLPFLQDYQLDRLIVFINPDIDPYGIGYNIIQSKIAVGSGRLTGKGLFAGTQNQLNFLPEKHTDFIFSVIGEEFGFLGVITLLLLYFYLIWQLLGVALQAKDYYGKLVVVGIVALFMFHILENIGMTMGIMPITGIPLPFISYGGSYMLTSLTAVGLAININLRKKKILF